MKLPVIGMVVALVLLVMPARAQDEAADAAVWQGVISGQIEAFRAGDEAMALSFAVARIRASFPDPREFVQWIRQGGYDPIVQSRSHSFGPYKLLSAGEVVQDVKFVGDDQLLYEAYYQLRIEDDVWRVNGVQLMKTPGVGI